MGAWPSHTSKRFSSFGWGGYISLSLRLFLFAPPPPPPHPPPPRVSNFARARTSRMVFYFFCSLFRFHLAYPLKGGARLI